MKRIPEKFELSEEDIREAIAYWLNNTQTDNEYEEEYTINFSTERVAGTPPPGAPVGGMSDYSTMVVTAVATKD